MEYVIEVNWDKEAAVWMAVCDSIPLALESGSLDALIERIKIAAPEMLIENNLPADKLQLVIRAERRELFDSGGF